ncbi:MAG TPA: restriction endonuclease subunit S [Allocoleopsis sp.]
MRSQTVKEVNALWTSDAYRRLAGIDESCWLPLKDLVSIQGGGTPSKDNAAFWEGSIPWVCPRDMKTQEIFDSTDHISEYATQQSSAKLIGPGAVLVVVRGMILVHTVPSAVLRVSSAINQDMKALIPKSCLLPEYLCKILWVLNREILEMVERSSHDTRKLQTSNLLDFKIPVPSVEEQQQIITHLEQLQAKVSELKKLQAQTATELDALLPSMLDKAFKGEL